MAFTASKLFSLGVRGNAGTKAGKSRAGGAACEGSGWVGGGAHRGWCSEEGREDRERLWVSAWCLKEKSVKAKLRVRIVFGPSGDQIYHRASFIKRHRISMYMVRARTNGSKKGANMRNG